MGSMGIFRATCCHNFYFSFRQLDNYEIKPMVTSFFPSRRSDQFAPLHLRILTSLEVRQCMAETLHV